MTYNDAMQEIDDVCTRKIAEFENNATIKKRKRQELVKNLGFLREDPDKLASAQLIIHQKNEKTKKHLGLSKIRPKIEFGLTNSCLSQATTPKKSTSAQLSLPTIEKPRMLSATKTRQGNRQAIDFASGNALLFPSFEKKNVNQNYASTGRINYK